MSKHFKPHPLEVEEKKDILFKPPFLDEVHDEAHPVCLASKLQYILSNNCNFLSVFRLDRKTKKRMVNLNPYISTQNTLDLTATNTI